MSRSLTIAACLLSLASAGAAFAQSSGSMGNSAMSHEPMGNGATTGQNTTSGKSSTDHDSMGNGSSMSNGSAMGNGSAMSNGGAMGHSANTP